MIEVNEVEPESAGLRLDTGARSFLIMKTVNDREFDVSLINKFNKNDYKKTKVCRESLKPIIKALEQNDLVNFDFDWTACFKYSVFQEELQNEIVPIILVLRKFARSNAGNRSLRSVLARKLVNFKLQFGVMDPDEFPTFDDFTNVDEKHNLLVKSGEADGNYALKAATTEDKSPIYQDSIYREGDMMINNNYLAMGDGVPNDY